MNIINRDPVTIAILIYLGLHGVFFIVIYVINVFRFVALIRHFEAHHPQICAKFPMKITGPLYLLISYRKAFVNTYYRENLNDPVTEKLLANDRRFHWKVIGVSLIFNLVAAAIACSWFFLSISWYSATH